MVAGKRPLEGLGVLVTRPRHQADHLCQAVEAAGGVAFRLPVLEILPPSRPEALAGVLDRLAEFDWALFVSVNAVEHGLQAALARGPLPPGLKLAVIGASSARALEPFGLRADLCPPPPYNSESLLALAEWREMTGKRVVIFRGEGGRELIATTLRERGAAVAYAEAYRRGRPQVDAAPVRAALAAGRVQLATATSNEALVNLKEMVGEEGWPWLRQVAVVVVSERAARLAAELGFARPALVAPEAGDGALLAAMSAWAAVRH